jgi:chromosome segregation ATPase
MNEVEYLRKDRDRWLEAWKQVVRSAAETRQRHEVEKAALLECIKKQDARITDLETRRTMLREQVEGERTMRIELHEDIDCVLARMEGGGA